MGVYLTIVASADVHYRGDYARHDIMWRRSELCKLAGFVATFSGELGVLTLTVITVERFIVIVLNSPLVRLGMRRMILLLATLWMSVFTLCLIPAFDTSYFENFYGHSEMCLPVPIASERQTKLGANLQETDVEGVAEPVVTIANKPSGWEYSVFIFVGINGAAFLAILIMYVWMFVAVKRTRAAIRSGRLTHDGAVARKMILIVGTDALCWIPVIGLGIYCLVGNTVSMRVGILCPSVLLI